MNIAKLFTFLIVVLILLLVSLFLLRNPLVKLYINHFVQTENNLQVLVEGVDLSLIDQSLLLKNLSIHQPPNYPETEMLVISELYLNISPIGFALGKTHFKQINFVLEKILVIKANDELNIQHLPSLPTPSNLRIDEMHVTIKNLYFMGSPDAEPMEIPVNYTATYTNVENFKDILPKAGLQAAIETLLP